MFNSYETTKALVDQRQGTLCREARERRLARIVRGERRHRHPASSATRAA